MTNKAILLTAALAGIINAQGQANIQAQPAFTIQWQQSYGGNTNDGARVIKQTSDGGYILGGYSFSGISGNKTNAGFGDFDYWLVKLDTNGNKQWDRSLGGSGEDQFTTLQQTADGGYIAGGYSISPISGNKTNAGFGDFDYWVTKLDANGNKLWDKSFGGDSADFLYSLQQTSDGGYILGGHSYSGISGNKTNANFGVNDFWLVKIDANGNKQWDKSYGGTSYDFLVTLQQTTDGGYVLGGYSSSPPSGNKTNINFGGYDYWIVKTDNLGNKQWDQSFGGDTHDNLTALRQTSDGGYIVAGYTLSGVSGNKISPSFGSTDGWLVKLNASGNKQWDQSFGGDILDYINSVQQTSEGGYILGGYSDSPASGNKTGTNFGGYDCWIVKVDPTGTKQWDQTIGGNNADYLSSMIQTSDGGYAFGGISYSGVSGNKTTPSFGGADYWIVKLAIPTFRFNSFSMGSNRVFQAQLTGSPGTSYIFQASTNLINWNPLSTNSATNGLVNFSDTNAPGFPKRFYRAQQLP